MDAEVTSGAMAIAEAIERVGLSIPDMRDVAEAIKGLAIETNYAAHTIAEGMKHYEGLVEIFLKITAERDETIPVQAGWAVAYPLWNDEGTEIVRLVHEPVLAWVKTWRTGEWRGAKPYQVVFPLTCEGIVESEQILRRPDGSYRAPCGVFLPDE